MTSEKSTNLNNSAFSQAKTYHATRPDYDKEAVEFLLEKVGAKPNESESVILELGAGTGKLTKDMLEILKGDSKTKIIASDPSWNMCKEFKEMLPDVEMHQFAAEKIGLYNSTIFIC